MASQDPIICPTCGASAPRGARFCPRCGGGLPAPIGHRRPRRLRLVAGGVTAVALTAATILVVGTGPFPNGFGPGPAPAQGDVEVALPDPAAQDAASDPTPEGITPQGITPQGITPQDTTPDDAATGEGAADPDAPPSAWVRCASEEGPVRCVASVARLGISEDDAVHVLDPGIVVADDGGLVRLHDATDGTEIWRTRLLPPLRVHGLVAGTVAVGSALGVHFLDADGGTEVGVHRVGVLDAVPNGPWLAVATADDTIVAVGVTGEPSWVRNVPTDGRAWLTDQGSYVEDGDGTVRALYPNTGTDRWTVELRGTVVAVHRSDDRTMVVLDDPPSTVTIDDAGEILRRSELAGGAVTWSGLHPDRARVVTVTHHAAAFSTLSVTSMLTGEVVVTSDTRGRTAGPDPVLVGNVAALPLVGARPQLRLIDLSTGGIRGLYSLGAPFAAIGLPDEQTVALLDDRGTVTVHSVDPQRERYSVAFGRDAAIVAGGPLRVRSGLGLTTLDARAGA